MSRDQRTPVPARAPSSSDARAAPGARSVDPPGISVMICTYNAARRLPKTLEHLAAQRVAAGVPWDVAIVDTGSTDGTKDVARTQWQALGAPAPLSVYDSSPGLPAARREGLRRARHGLVLFCDDDNWLDKNYLRIAQEVMDADAGIGVLGGCGEAVFEAEAPTWFARAEPYFAVGPQADVSGDVTETKGYVYGAGFVIRKSAWDRIAQHGHESLLGSFRRGSNDKEMCYLVRLAGYAIAYDERLRFAHFMPASRFDWLGFLAHGYHAHKTATLLEPYTYVLDQAEYTPPSTWHWLTMAKKHATWLTKASPALLPKHSRAWSRFKHACRRGNLAGWLHMRRSFREQCDRVHVLRLAAYHRDRP